MFPGSSSSTDLQYYDFENEENAAKWKGLFVNPLKKVRQMTRILTINKIGDSRF